MYNIGNIQSEYHIYLQPKKTQNIYYKYCKLGMFAND